MDHYETFAGGGTGQILLSGSVFAQEESTGKGGAKDQDRRRSETRMEAEAVDDVSHCGIQYAADFHSGEVIYPEDSRSVALRGVADDEQLRGGHPGAHNYTQDE